MLLAYIRSIQSDQVAADDTWQETMLVAWRRLDDYDTSRPFGPWLRGIAQKIVLASYSKSKGKVTIADSESLEYLSQRFESVQSLKGDTLDEKLEALRDCIATLSDPERQCIELRYTQNLMPAELSDRIGIALETVKKRLLRAKQRLVHCITSKIEVARTQEATL
jgi:RNA polymerase sigma factor (sigma-70 family)